MKTAVPFMRYLWVGMRIEYTHVKRSPAFWLFCALAIAVAAVLGRAEPAGWEPLFGPLHLALFLTVATTLWGWQATTQAISPAARELYVSRGADERALHLARIVLIGLAWGLITMGCALVIAVPRTHDLGLWWYLLLWSPHTVLAHVLSAAVGGAAALVFAGRPAVGMIAAGGGWWAVVSAATRFGPLAPDPLLRALQWNHLLRDAAAEPLYLPLLIGFAAAVLAIIILGLECYGAIWCRQAGNARLAPGRAVVWWVALVLLAAGWGVLSRQLDRRQAALGGPPPQSPAAGGQVVWDPGVPALVAEGLGGEAVVYRGPVRPTAVALSEQGFASYIGRHGVAVPLAVLAGAGPYDLEVLYPSGWELHGCSTRHPVEPGRHRCRGAAAELDWLVLLPSSALTRAAETTRRLDPQRARAEALFQRLIEAGAARLGRGVPDILHAGPGPTWLSADTLMWTGPQVGDPAVMPRVVVHDAALALASQLSGVRQPWTGLGPEPAPPGAEQTVPPALLATLDRLLFEVGALAVDPLEASRRSGLPADRSAVRYLPLPQADQAEFNRWWIAVNELLGAGGIPAEEVWAAVGRVHSLSDARKWPETAAATWRIDQEGS